MPSLVTRVSHAAGTAFPVMVGASALALPAWLLHAPFLTPPLGASVYLCLKNRGTRAASPATVVFSHVTGVICGLIARMLCGVNCAGLDGPNMTELLAAAVVALGLTTFVLDLFDRIHPPAGATTLVVAFGLLTTTASQFALIGAAVLLAVLVGLRDRLHVPRPA